MATNDAVAAYTGQQNAAAAEYKDAWASAPSAGVGQFGSQGPFSNSAAGLSSTSGADVSALKTAAAQAVQPPAVLSGANIDALPTTPAGATSADPIKGAIETTSNFSSATPYVSDVTDAGDVGRQAVRPERLAIDETMTADEQYRRAWQNEANGYFGNNVATSAQPESPGAATTAPDTPVASQPVVASEYGLSFGNDGLSGDSVIATIYDKATGKAMHKVEGRDARNMRSLLGGAGVATPEQLKQITGWDPSTPGNATGPNEWRPSHQEIDGDFA